VSLDLLRRRCQAAPAALLGLLRAPPPLPALPPGPVLATGIGGSEGPARLLVSLLQARGLPARFVPLSSFVDGAPPASSLVVFSQKLSPNASLALARARRYPRALLVTSMPPDEPRLAPFVGDGGAILSLPCDDEAGLLVRVLGPTLASAAAALLADNLCKTHPGNLLEGCREPLDIDALDRALTRALARAAAWPALPPGLLALVAGGDAAERCEGLRWRLLEGLLRPDVQLWDALSAAHGPLQSFWDREATLLALEAPGDLSPSLVDRLASVLVPGRHQLLRLTASLPAPWSLFEHMVQLDALMCRSLEAFPRPLDPWPAQGLDGPLYLLGPG